MYGLIADNSDQTTLHILLPGGHAVDLPRAALARWEPLTPGQYVQLANRDGQLTIARVLPKLSHEEFLKAVERSRIKLLASQDQEREWAKEFCRSGSFKLGPAFAVRVGQLVACADPIDQAIGRLARLMYSSLTVTEEPEQAGAAD
jgi:hypothetical protein